MDMILTETGLSLINHNVLFLRYFCLVDRQRKAPIMLGLSFFIMFRSIKRYRPSSKFCEKIDKQAQIYFQDKPELNFILKTKLKRYIKNFKS
jgi:hypothetical protein